jgi:hypothetical protein
MPPLEGQQQRVSELRAHDVVEFVLRVLASLLGIVFLLGYSRFARHTSDPGIHVLMLSQVVLMFLCAMSPSRASRIMLGLLLIVLAAFAISLVITLMSAMPRLLDDYAAVVVVSVYAVETGIAIWFIRKHASSRHGLSSKQ